jgi:hypothetical protein
VGGRTRIGREPGDDRGGISGERASPDVPSPASGWSVPTVVAEPQDRFCWVGAEEAEGALAAPGPRLLVVDLSEG